MRFDRSFWPVPVVALAAAAVSIPFADWIMSHGKLVALGFLVVYSSLVCLLLSWIDAKVCKRTGNRPRRAGKR